MTKKEMRELVRLCQELVEREGQWNDDKTRQVVRLGPEAFVYRQNAFIRVRVSIRHTTERKFQNERWSTVFQLDDDGGLHWGFTSGAPVVLDLVRKHMVLDILADV
jgi:hypothetical protein